MSDPPLRLSLPRKLPLVHLLPPCSGRDKGAAERFSSFFVRRERPPPPPPAELLCWRKGRTDGARRRKVFGKSHLSRSPWRGPPYPTTALHFHTLFTCFDFFQRVFFFLPSRCWRRAGAREEAPKEVSCGGCVGGGPKRKKEK